jgi:hypothetical protein
MIASDIQFPKFPPEIYGRIALNDLVTYAVYFLSQNGGEINAEDIVATCFLAVAGAEADAIRREHVNLQNKYAHKIHECFVDANHRRLDGQQLVRKGRPSRETLLAKAVVSSD